MSDAGRDHRFLLRTGWRRWLGIELVLILLLCLEVGIFSRTGTNFWTTQNFFEVLRLSVEIGLLAVAMTPVILTGGIDLSVGSLLGLCAIVFGKLWRDAGFPPMLAGIATIALGIGLGGLNGALVTRLRLPPLIVTLGSYSLFRGFAEAITKGVDNFTKFPDSFLFLGQGYWFGVVPAQLPLFILVALGVWLLVHRTAFGRGLRVMGFSPEGALYAGLPVSSRLMIVYGLAGGVSALSSLVYVAHVGQAKADAGTGYELLAITAVVLGGTSIFGGKGSVHGTLLGLAVLAVMKNGLLLSDLPGELVGIVTGLLLLTVLSGELFMRFLSRKPPGRGRREGPGQ